MPSFIVKPRRDEDFYVEYSTVVDAPIRWGGRAHFQAAHDRLIAQQVTDDRYTADRFLRADENGSSCLPFDLDGTPLGWYWWKVTTFQIMEGPGGPGTIERDHLRAYCEAWDRSSEDAVVMVKPFEDYEEGPGDDPDDGHRDQRDGSEALDPGAVAQGGSGDRQ